MKLMLLEVKSTKSLEPLMERKKPYDSHAKQLQLYMFALGLREGGVLYVEKNTLKTLLFPVKYDEKAAEEVLKKFDRLHFYLSNNKLPPPEATAQPCTRWMCNYCEYKEECQRNELPARDEKSHES